jgi:hypothetical protein
MVEFGQGGYMQKGDDVITTFIAGALFFSIFMITMVLSLSWIFS